MAAIIQIEREFLMSKLVVPNDKAERFRQQVSKTLSVFEKNNVGPTLGWHLAISCVTDKKNGKVEFLHIWKTPKSWSLYTAMNFLATDREYAALHDCVEDEEQHLLGTENMYSPSGLAPVAATKLVMESFRLPSDRVAVARLQFGMKLLAQKMLRNHGWRLLVALQHQTGKLGTRVHVWGVGTGAEGEQVADHLDQGKKALLDSDLYQSHRLLRERSAKLAQNCKIDTRFADYDPVDYRV